ncbi:unnamed protein product [Caretta caretta]
MGGIVLLRVFQPHNKFSTPFYPEPHKITMVKGMMVTVQRGSHKVTLIASHIKPICGTHRVSTPQDNDDGNLTETEDLHSLQSKYSRQRDLEQGRGYAVADVYLYHGGGGGRWIKPHQRGQAGLQSQPLNEQLGPGLVPFKYQVWGRGASPELLAMH